MIRKTFEITDPAGMHARPASALVSSLARFQSDITMEYKGKNVNLKSILGVMSMGIPSGSTVIITANGIDEVEAMDSIEKTLNTVGLSDE